MDSTPWDPEGVTVALDPEGRLSEELGAPGVDLEWLYKILVAARCLDVRLQRAELPLWTSAAGEEAPLTAAALAAETHDWIYPGLRDAAVALARGMGFDTLVRTLAAGKGIASAAHRLGPPPDALAMQLPMACGHAQAQKLAGDRAITFACFGEGVTTTGPFHEAVMMAVHGDLPIVFVCRSQLWPEGAPAEAGLVGDSVSERARTAGLWARRVDGADAVASYAAVRAAAQRARDGRGPGLVEAVVTRLHHAEVPAHRDPIERLRRHLDAAGVWSQTFHDVVEAEVNALLDRALEQLATASEEEDDA